METKTDKKLKKLEAPSDAVLKYCRQFAQETLMDAISPYNTRLFEKLTENTLGLTKKHRRDIYGVYSYLIPLLSMNGIDVDSSSIAFIPCSLDVLLQEYTKKMPLNLRRNYYKSLVRARQTNSNYSLPNGFATMKYVDGEIIHIVLVSGETDDARQFLGTLAHEIGGHVYMNQKGKNNKKLNEYVRRRDEAFEILKNKTGFSGKEFYNAYFDGLLDVAGRKDNEITKALTQYRKAKEKLSNLINESQYLSEGWAETIRNRVMKYIGLYLPETSLHEECDNYDRVLKTCNTQLSDLIDDIEKVKITPENGMHKLQEINQKILRIEELHTQNLQFIEESTGKRIRGYFHFKKFPEEMQNRIAKEIGSNEEFFRLKPSIYHRAKERLKNVLSKSGYRRKLPNVA